MRIKLFLILILALNSRVFGQDLSGSDILLRTGEISTADSAVMLMEMKLLRPDKEERVYKIQSFKKGNDKMHIKFLEPPKVVGRFCLRNGNNMWLYIPSINKAMRISPQQLVMDGEFTQADLMRVNLIDDYNASISGIEKYNDIECYVLELKAKDRSIAYDRVKFWVKKSDFFPVRQEYYAISGKLLKILSFGDPALLGGRIRPKTLFMESALKKGFITVLTMIEMKVDVKIPDYMFNVGQLTHK